MPTRTGAPPPHRAAPRLCGGSAQIMRIGGEMQQSQDAALLCSCQSPHSAQPPRTPRGGWSPPALPHTRHPMGDGVPQHCTPHLPETPRELGVPQHQPSASAPLHGEHPNTEPPTHGRECPPRTNTTPATGRDTLHPPQHRPPLTQPPTHLSTNTTPPTPPKKYTHRGGGKFPSPPTRPRPVPAARPLPSAASTGRLTRPRRGPREAPSRPPLGPPVRLTAPPTAPPAELHVRHDTGQPSRASRRAGMGRPSPPNAHAQSR